MRVCEVELYQASIQILSSILQVSEENPFILRTISPRFYDKRPPLPPPPAATQAFAPRPKGGSPAENALALLISRKAIFHQRSRHRQIGSLRAKGS